MERTGRELRVGLIGYGEVGRILTRTLVKAGQAWVGAWDRLLLDGEKARDLRAAAAADGVVLVDSMAALLAEADLVISAVTASQAAAAADEAAGFIRAGTWYLDLNSASPETKTKSGSVIGARGGRFVEAGVMSSVPPHGIRVPMLLGGPDAATAEALLKPLGFVARAVSDRLGVASAIKMCRSVMIKGLEAIVIESFTTARRYGVEREVLASLAETYPAIDWQEQGSYLFSRVVAHGRRRAEEMREAALTVREAGLEPLMANAIAERQASIASLAASDVFRGLSGKTSWEEYADRVLGDDVR
jgi:3-hydroxyisobutyrate dehydrogenase-like beta-hydroxyacid dehydrogenase